MPRISKGKNKKQHDQNLFALSEEVIRNIQNVFKKYLPIEEVIIYGSRAKGNFQKGSDIDLVLKGNDLKLEDLLKIENELDDLLLPYKIDLSLYIHLKDKDLLDHIDRVGKIFYCS